jgi:CRP-like cAMP-binding protein
VTHDKLVDVCGPNDAIGFMSVIDSGSLTATARVREAAELSLIDERTFRFMIDEVPNFTCCIMNSRAEFVARVRSAPAIRQEAEA